MPTAPLPEDPELEAGDGLEGESAPPDEAERTELPGGSSAAGGAAHARPRKRGSNETKRYFS